MSILSNSHTIFYLKARELSVYNERTGLLGNFSITGNYVANLRLISKDNFEYNFKDFLKTLGVKPNNSVLLISDEYLFKKVFASLFDENIKAESSVNAFSDTIPLEKDDILKTVVQEKENVTIYLTSRKFIRDFIVVFEKIGFKVHYSLPASFFITDSDSQSIDLSKFQKLKKKTNYLKSLNMNTATNLIKPKKIFFIPIFLVGVFVILGILVFNYSKIFLDKPVNAVNQKPLESTQSTVSRPSQQNSLPNNMHVKQEGTTKKEDIKIQVLNGSGIAGEAAKTKILLNALGYKQVDTGNFDGLFKDNTIIEIYLDIPSNYVKEISDALTPSYTNVVVKKLEKSGYDIQIILGRK